MLGDPTSRSATGRSWPSSASTTPARPLDRSSTTSSSDRPVPSDHPRDVFIVANNIEELGGAIRFVHTLARLLSEQGHRVRLIGIVHRQEHFDYGPDVPYERHVLHRRHPPRPADPKGMARLNPRLQARRKARQLLQRAGARRLSRLLKTSEPGAVLIVAQIFAMEWVRLADTSRVSVIGMSHEFFAAARALPPCGGA